MATADDLSSQELAAWEKVMAPVKVKKKKKKDAKKKNEKSE